MRLERHVSCGRLVGVGIEQETAAVARQIAALRGGCWMGERAPRRITKERLGGFGPSLATVVAPLGPVRTSFGVIGGFELMIACGFMQELLERRRCVVFR